MSEKRCDKEYKNGQPYNESYNDRDKEKKASNTEMSSHCIKNKNRKQNQAKDRAREHVSRRLGWLVACHLLIIDRDASRQQTA